MKNKGNILVVFIMLVGLSFMVFSVATVITTHVRQSGTKTSEAQAFYAAEAGLNKALWYLRIPVSGGGKGSDWRGATTEVFSRGSYQITVQDTAIPSEVSIISTGEVLGASKTITQHASIEETFPAAFNYAVYCNNNLEVRGNAEISGDLFVNGNTAFTSNAELENGVVYHPEGYSVSGAPDGGTPDPIPTMPGLDTSYYDNQIT